MKADLETETQLVNNLHKELNDRRILQGEFKECLEDWSSNIGVFWKDPSGDESKNKFIPCNVEFKLTNGKEYYITFLWEEVSINNPKNLTQKTLNRNKLHFKTTRSIWKEKHFFNQTWVIVTPRVNTLENNNTDKINIFCVSYEKFMNFFISYFDKINNN